MPLVGSFREPTGALHFSDAPLADTAPKEDAERAQATDESFMSLGGSEDGTGLGSTRRKGALRSGTGATGLPGPVCLGPGAFGLAWWFAGQGSSQDEEKEAAESPREAKQLMHPVAKALPMGEPQPCTLKKGVALAGGGCAAGLLGTLTEHVEQALHENGEPKQEHDDRSELSDPAPDLPSPLAVDIDADAPVEENEGMEFPALQPSWPWLTSQAPLMHEQRRRLAAEALELPEATSRHPPSAAEALHLLRWCWHHDCPWLAAAGLLPLIDSFPESLVFRWIVALLFFAVWRRAVARLVAHVPEESRERAKSLQHYLPNETRQAALQHRTDAATLEYLVDNTQLKAPTRGLGYRQSKQLDDLDTSKTALWGVTVRGIEHPDGWLEVGNVFLPMALNGIPVLTPTEPGRALAGHGLPSDSDSVPESALQDSLRLPSHGHAAAASDQAPSWNKGQRPEAQGLGQGQAQSLEADFERIALVSSPLRERGATLGLRRHEPGGPQRNPNSPRGDWPPAGLPRVPEESDSISGETPPPGGSASSRLRREEVHPSRLRDQSAMESQMCRADTLRERAVGALASALPTSDHDDPLPLQASLRPQRGEQLVSGRPGKSPHHNRQDRLEGDDSQAVASAMRSWYKTDTSFDRPLELAWQRPAESRSRSESEGLPEARRRKVRNHATSSPDAGRPHPDDRGQQPDSALLVQDLRKALQRSVEKRQELDAQIAASERAQVQRQGALQEELQVTELEAAAAQERRALQDATATLLTQAHAGSSTLPTGGGGAETCQGLRTELRAVRAAADVATQRAAALQAELRWAKQQGPGHGMASPANTSVQELRAEVLALRAELEALQGKEGEERANSAVAGPSAAAAAAGVAAQRAQALTERRAQVRAGEAALELERAELRAAAAEVAEANSLAGLQRVECQALAERAEDAAAEELILRASGEPLRREVETLGAQYQQLKRLLAAYTAALCRKPSQGQGQSTPGGKGVQVKKRGQKLEQQARGAGGDSEGGLTAESASSSLVQALARRCGWPELAFLNLMGPPARGADREVRGLGRLRAEDLNTGLLLGLGLDYPSITGQTAQSLLTAMDQRGVGSISAADLAAHCPSQWQAYGALPPSPAERLLSLPWAAAGGPGAAFDTAVQQQQLQQPQQQQSSQNSKAAGLPWQCFKRLLCQEMRGLCEDDARKVFSKLRSADGAVSRAAWESAMKMPSTQHAIQSSPSAQDQH